MASGGQYGGGDVVDEWLMNKVVRHVSHDELGSLARHLRIDKSVYANISAPNDRIFEVSNQQVSSLYHRPEVSKGPFTSSDFAATLLPNLIYCFGVVLLH